MYAFWMGQTTSKNLGLFCINVSCSQKVRKNPRLKYTNLSNFHVFSCSVSLSQMLQVGKLIEPETNVMTLDLEEFSTGSMKRLNSFLITISMQPNPFGQGAFREAHMAKALSGLPQADYVLKKYKKD